MIKRPKYIVKIDLDLFRIQFYSNSKLYNRYIIIGDIKVFPNNYNCFCSNFNKKEHFEIKCPSNFKINT